MVLGAAALVASMLRPGLAGTSAGDLGSPVWANAVHERFEKTDVYVLEDATSVYLAFAASGASDPGDAVTVYLWSDKSAYSFTVDEHGNRSATCSAGAAALPQWGADERAAKDGYTVTMQLPRALFSGGQSRWLAQFARVLPQSHLAYTWPQSPGDAGNVMYSAPFDASPGGAYTAKVSNAEPAVSPAGTKGVKVTQTADNLAVTALAAQSADGSQQTSASLGWTSTDQRATAGVQRTANAGGSGTAVMQALSVGYDNQQNMRLAAGLSAQDGTKVSDFSQATYDYYDFSLYGKNSTIDMRWNAAGPQYDPSGDDAPAAGTSGYTLSLSQTLGNVSLEAAANRYRDDFGKLSQANESAAITAALSPALTFDVNAAADAVSQDTGLPFFQDTAGLRYAKDGAGASISVHEEHFLDGSPQRASMSGGFTLPLLMHLGSVSAGYQNTAGMASVTFSFQHKLPIGLLRATYSNPNTASAAPNFSLKLVHL